MSRKTYRRTKEGWIDTSNPGVLVNPHNPEQILVRSTKPRPVIVQQKKRMIRTPLGTYRTLREAADAHELSKEGLRRRILIGKPGYEYIILQE